MKKVKLLAIGILTATLLILPAVVLANANKVTAIPYTGAPQQVVPLDAGTILVLVNKERQNAGMKPLVSDPRLVAAAQAKADDMATSGYYAHINPTTNKNGYTYVFDTSGDLCSYASENLSQMLDPKGDNNLETVNGWINSKPHHDAMLDPSFTYTGVAVNGEYIVQHFCRQ